MFSPISIPLEKLNLPRRITHALLRAGLISIEDVIINFNNNGIYEIRNLGELSIQQIKMAVNEFNYLDQPLIETSGASTLTDNKKPTENSQISNQEKPSVLIIDQILFDLPIDLISDFTKNKDLLMILNKKIQFFGELGLIYHFYNSLLLSENLIVDKVIGMLEKKIVAMINAQKINSEAKIVDQKIGSIIKSEPVKLQEKVLKISYLKKIFSNQNFNYEIEDLFRNIDDKHISIFFLYYLERNTLEQISHKYSVTRERIRQQLVKVNYRLRNKLKLNSYIYIQSALYVGQNLGSDLSKDKWRSELLKLGILSNQKVFNDKDVFEVFMTLLVNKEINEFLYPITDEMKTVLSSTENLQAKVIKAFREITTEQKREISRIAKFTGGINISFASQILNQPIEISKAILNKFGLIEVIPEWFTFGKGNQVTVKSPIIHSGLLMLKVCGPLKIESFLDGIRKYISRHYEMIAPVEVVKYYLKFLGFRIDENEYVFWDQKYDVVYSQSELCLLNLLNEKGPLLSFQEIVVHFLENKFSIVTATAKIMGSSPLLERIETGYYKIRGYEHSWEELNSVIERQTKYTRDAEVIYGMDGLIRYRITLDTWCLGGVISIKQSDQPLPNFEDGWNVYVNDILVGLAKRDNYLIWGLSPVFSTLNCTIGDRLELEFNTWNEPFISARIINETPKR